VKNRILGLKRRLAGMLLDHIIMSFAFVPVLIVISLIFGTGEPMNISVMERLSFLALFFFYFNKDYFGARSLAKRSLGLVVISNKTNEKAIELQCFLRNITIPLWPLEVLVTLFSRSRRMGDLIANTRVEAYDKTSMASLVDDIKSYKLNPVSMVTIGTGIVYSVFLWLLLGTLSG
tara:strand:- start:1197 stop:1724 length:528 start_codon:yes stop_codon:yes gene_type:complete